MMFDHGFSFSKVALQTYSFKMFKSGREALNGHLVFLADWGPV